MRYCTLFLFCLLFAANAFGQSDSIQLLPTRVFTTDSTHYLRDNNSERFIYVHSCRKRTSNKPVKTTPPIITIKYEEYSLPVNLPCNTFRFQNINQIANTQAGVLSVDGETPSILGARTEGTAYYINGVRVLEGFLPQTLE